MTQAAVKYKMIEKLKAMDKNAQIVFQDRKQRTGVQHIREEAQPSWSEGIGPVG